MTQEDMDPYLKTLGMSILWPQIRFTQKMQGGCIQSLGLYNAVVLLEGLYNNLTRYWSSNLCNSYKNLTS